jgi:glycerol-3-phosphate acyltransferase PlsY
MSATAVAIIAGAYAAGSVPVAWMAGRWTKGIDLRRYGSGNVGASNVWQSVSRTLVVPVGLAQIGQGLLGPGIAKLAGEPESVQVAAGLAALVAHNWSPWLRFSGGRGVGVAIGFLLMMSPPALVAFIVVALLGVALRAIPQGVGLGIVLSPVVAAAAGGSAAVVAGCAVMAALVLLKRVLANAMPESPAADVFVNRLLYDRDIRDREAWVRRSASDPDPAAPPHAGAHETRS